MPVVLCLFGIIIYVCVHCQFMFVFFLFKKDSKNGLSQCIFLHNRRSFGNKKKKKEIEKKKKEIKNKKKEGRTEKTNMN